MHKFCKNGKMVLEAAKLVVEWTPAHWTVLYFLIGMPPTEVKYRVHFDGNTLKIGEDFGYFIGYTNEPKNI